MLDRLSREGTVVARTDGSSHRVFPVAVTPEEGRGAARLGRARAGGDDDRDRPRLRVAALHACAGLIDAGTPEPRHLVLDPHQHARFSDVGLQLLNEAGVADLVEFHPRASEFALPSFLEEGRSFDVAVVDGNHRFDGVFVDLRYLGRLLRPTGIVFLDDYQLPGVARAASFFVANVGWQNEEISPADDLHQWVVLRTPATPDERSFEHFVDF